MSVLPDPCIALGREHDIAARQLEQRTTSGKQVICRGWPATTPVLSHYLDVHVALTALPSSQCAWLYLEKVASIHALL